MIIRRLLLLGAAVVLCLVLLTLQTRNHSTAAANLLAYVTTPIQTVLAKGHRVAVGVWSTYLEWKNMRAENIELREEVRRLRVSSLQVDDIAGENRRLRGLLELQERLPLTTLTGEIIARDWGGWGRSLTVNRGRGDRVARLTAVLTPDGLLGRVVDVRPGVSIVQVLTDPASTVGGHLVRTRTPGIVEGEAKGTIRFKYMARDGADIEVGDLVVTSGQGGVFPRGVPVGRVTAIDNRGSALFHYAMLEPMVDYSRVDEVLLVTGPGAPPDLTAYFATGG